MTVTGVLESIKLDPEHYIQVEKTDSGNWYMRLDFGYRIGVVIDGLARQRGMLFVMNELLNGLLGLLFGPIRNIVRTHHWKLADVGLTQAFAFLFEFDIDDVKDVLQCMADVWADATGETIDVEDAYKESMYIKIP